MSTEETTQRKIIHVDMDSFYAAVEVRENPQLKGKPIAVGGQPGSRGVIATCSYEARKFGVHSAMPVNQAIKLCPDLIMVPVRIPLYKEVSGHIHDIFQQFTDLIEPLSLDEAYLDVSNVSLCKGSATLMAQEIRQRIFESQGLTASAGIAPNKFLAKVASDWNKPNGQKLVAPNEVDEFVKQLPVTAIFGVGKVTGKKMAELHIKTCADLQEYTIDELSQHFGKFGTRLYQYSRGIDNRPVQTDWVRKSLSVEDTFSKDLVDLETCLTELPVIYQELCVRYERALKQQKLAPRTLFVKMRFNDFETTTVQMAGTQPDLNSYQHLFEQAWQRGRRPVRLLGIGMQFKSPELPEQLNLFD